MLGTLLGIPLVLLPPRYRGRAQGADLVGAALAAGALQALGCVAALVLLYVMYFDARVQAMAGQFVAGGVDDALGGRGVQAGMGAVVTLEYLLRPQSVALIYFASEGVVRVAAALASQEIIGTLPLYVVSWVHGAVARRAAEHALGPKIGDEVERVEAADHTLRIASCRCKPNWNGLMTVSYQDELLEVVREERGEKPRPFVYLLRPKPEGKVVRGLHHYAADEALRKEE